MQSRQLIGLQKSPSLFLNESVPGKEQVPVGYGFYLPKCIFPTLHKGHCIHLKKFILTSHFMYQPSWENFHKMLWLQQYVTLNKMLVVYMLILIILTVQSTEQPRRVTDTLSCSCHDLVCLSLCNTEYYFFWPSVME